MTNDANDKENQKPRPAPISTWLQIFLLVIVIGIVVAVALLAGADNSKLQTAVGYVLLFLISFFGLVVIVDMLRGSIDLSELLDEVDGGASMSRFQLLIFTFIIGLSLFMLVAGGGKFPSIPSEILTLLGISASTYGVSKGIQLGTQSQPGDQTPPANQPAVNQPPANQPDANQPPANQPHN